MCGIIGFTGRLEAQKILTEGLAALEYRGYDSAGIAYFKDTGKISIRKTVGKVKQSFRVHLRSVSCSRISRERFLLSEM